MPTLYTLKDTNIRKTYLLITIFLLFIIGIGWILSYLFERPEILIIAAIFAILTSITSYWYSDKVVLYMTRARPVKREDNPELYRIVENLCITAGLPMPKIYILDEEQPNAFATGRDPNHSVVAVTRGLLKMLERSELEGVIAHELSHIKNRDMLLQTVVVVLAGMLSIACEIFLRSLWWGGGGRRKREENNIFYLLGLIAIILAPIAATLIRLAISRKREFLADATGALLTRYPEGLARALEKIASDPHPMRVATSATAHLFIANPFRGKQSKSWFVKLFMTHPPVEERIKALREMQI
ncbi:M48 family metallopeptidase [bacterium]|nr:M48 family metallopeptidase [bacterium]